MQAAFEEYRGVLQPPSGAHDETVADVERVMAQGGAVLAWDADEPVGSARYIVYPDHVYVGRVAVLPSHRRRGIAARMMRFLEDVAQRAERPAIEVSVRGSLPSNVELYRSLGYEVVSVEAHPRGPDTTNHLRKRLV